jgi:cytochrome c-type biogenesis protein CcmE
VNPVGKKRLKATTVIVCFLAVIVAARLWYLEEQGNFHPITPGEAHRSAQLDQDELAYYQQKRGLMLRR